MQNEAATNEKVPVSTASMSSKKRIVTRVAALALLLMATLSLAAAQVADCTPGKLSDYQKLGATGCLIGDKKFSNFQYHQGLGRLASDAISVTPGTTPDSDDPGILFEGKWVSASQESFVSYTVEAQPQGKPIAGVSLEMQFGQITGTGTAKVLEQLCSLDAAAQSCGQQSLELKVVLCSKSRKPLDSIQFKQPHRQIQVTTPVAVLAGSGGSASLDGFMSVFR
jgi:hypothetical protein